MTAGLLDMDKFYEEGETVATDPAGLFETRTCFLRRGKDSSNWQQGFLNRDRFYEEGETVATDGRAVWNRDRFYEEGR